MKEFTTPRKCACLERELIFRRRNYPRWVAAGRMTQETAETETACMEAILADYMRQLRREIPELFGTADGN